MDVFFDFYFLQALNTKRQTHVDVENKEQEMKERGDGIGLTVSRCCYCTRSVTRLIISVVSNAADDTNKARARVTDERDLNGTGTEEQNGEMRPI